MECRSVDLQYGSKYFLHFRTKIRNFSIEVKDDEVEIRNNPETEIFNSIASRLQKKNHFLEMELDAENVKIMPAFSIKALLIHQISVISEPLLI